MKKIIVFAIIAGMVGAAGVIGYNRFSASRTSPFVQAVLADRELQQAKADAAAGMWYVDRLALSNLQLNDYRDASQGYSGGIFISGTIRNTGDRSVSIVYLSCVLLDDSGKPFYSIDADTHETIKPGYAVNFIDSDDHPAIVPDWRKQRFRVEIVGIELEN